MTKRKSLTKNNGVINNYFRLQQSVFQVFLDDEKPESLKLQRIEVRIVIQVLQELRYNRIYDDDIKIVL